jgi:hypothetical protein
LLKQELLVVALVDVRETVPILQEVGSVQVLLLTIVGLLLDMAQVAEQVAETVPQALFI